MYWRIATVASVALLTGCVDGSTWSWEHVGNYFSEEEIDEVIVDGDNADVRLSAGATSRVEVTEYRRSGAPDPDTHVAVEGGTLLIESDCPENRWRCASRFEVEVPEAYVMDLYMDVGAGDLDLIDLEGTADLHTGSGDIALIRFDGPVLAETGSGDIDGVDLTGTMALDTGSGDVVVDGVIGDISASTGSGDVQVTRLEADHAWLSTSSGKVDLLAYELRTLTATTGSGHITAEAICDLVAVDVETSSGDVRLDVESGRYDIEASSDSGDVRLVEVIDDPDADRIIEATTGSGDIRIVGH